MMIPIKKITPSVPNASITVGSFKYALTLVEYTAACSIIAPTLSLIHISEPTRH